MGKRKPKYKVGQLFFEKIKGRVWQIASIIEDREKDYYQCWYFLEIIKGHKHKAEVVVTEETFDRSMVAINSLDGIPTAKTLYGK